MRCLIVASLAVGLLLPAVASAGSAANPALTVGRENFGFSFEIEKQKKDLDGELATSTRWLGKTIWGATDKLDLYVRLGASDLQIPVAGGPDYHGKRGMTWGGGGRYMVAEVPQPAIKTYVDVQMLSFHTDGSVWRNFDGYAERYADHYKWNEVQFSFFGVWDRPVFDPYIGFSITNVFGRVTKDVYRVVGSVETLDPGESKAYDFREDAIPEMILGVDISLGGTGHLSGELRYSDHEDISFFVGASELWKLK